MNFFLMLMFLSDLCVFSKSVSSQRVPRSRGPCEWEALWREPSAGQLYLFPVRGGLFEDPRLTDHLLHPQGWQRGLG